MILVRYVMPHIFYTLSVYGFYRTGVNCRLSGSWHAGAVRDEAQGSLKEQSHLWNINQCKALDNLSFQAFM